MCVSVNSDEIALEMMNTYSHWEQIELLGTLYFCNFHDSEFPNDLTDQTNAQQIN